MTHAYTNSLGQNSVVQKLDGQAERRTRPIALLSH